MTLSSIRMLGFLLGMRHTLDADHLAEVAKLATRSRSVAQSVGLGVAWGIAYIAIFGAGSILGMAALAIAVPLWLTSVRLTRTYDALCAKVGVATVLLGCHIVYRIDMEIAA